MSSINSTAGGTISFDITIPAGTAAGPVTLIAMQHSTTNGALLNGFPVRAPFNVTAAASGKEAAPAGQAVPAAAGREPVASSAASSRGTAAAAVAGSVEIAPAGGAAVAGLVSAPAASSTGSASPEVAAVATTPGATGTARRCPPTTPW